MHSSASLRIRQGAESSALQAGYTSPIINL